VTGDFPFPWGDFLITTAVAAAVVVGLMAVVLTVSRRTGRVAVVDVAWGLGFISVALVSAVLGEILRSNRAYTVDSAAGVDAHHAFLGLVEDTRLRSWGLFVLVALWGGRLAWHIFTRSRGAGEDPRYEELMSRGNGGIVRKVLLPQGVAIWFVSIPVQMAAVVDGRVGVVGLLGLVVWLVGILFESIGDAQLSAYKVDPQRGPVMDRGLWRYTRHPNYFGDACVWWGIWLVMADVWPGVLTILSPLLMTYFLVFVSGARLLERTMMKRDGYPEYARRTSMILPLPPKRA
jgi:steroid 5-alpha reductase family enzyme